MLQSIDLYLFRLNVSVFILFLIKSLISFVLSLLYGDLLSS